MSDHETENAPEERLAVCRPHEAVFTPLPHVNMAHSGFYERLSEHVSDLFQYVGQLKPGGV